jgi:hypothetical protein
MSTTATVKQFFGSVPRDRFKLLGADNQPDAKRIANSFLHFRNEEISAVTGIPLQSVRFDARMPEALKARALEWATAINLVGEFFEDESRTILWFQTPNPLLGNITPKEMIMRGRFRKLLQFIQTALEENKK